MLRINELLFITSKYETSKIINFISESTTVSEPIQVFHSTSTTQLLHCIQTYRFKCQLWMWLNMSSCHERDRKGTLINCVCLRHTPSKSITINLNLHTRYKSTSILISIYFYYQMAIYIYYERDFSSFFFLLFFGFLLLFTRWALFTKWVIF